MKHWSPVVRLNGHPIRCWTFERYNSDIGIIGYDERERRRILEQRGFDLDRKVVAVRLDSGELQYRQDLA